MMPLVSVIAGLLPAVTWGGLPLSTWMTIVGALASSEPQIKQIIADSSSVIKKVTTAIDQGVPHQAIAAHMHAGGWKNVSETISGYAADGSVTEIQNPDAR